MQAKREIREKEARAYGVEGDLSRLSDTELNGIISLAGRKATHKDERGEQLPRRRRRR